MQICSKIRNNSYSFSVIHGKTSGLDIAICARGECGRLATATQGEHLDDAGGILTYRSSESPENITCSADLRLLIVNTRMERNTVYMINMVRQKVEKVTRRASKCAAAVTKNLVFSIQTSSIKSSTRWTPLPKRAPVYSARCRSNRPPRRRCRR